MKKITQPRLNGSIIDAMPVLPFEQVESMLFE